VITPNLVDRDVDVVRRRVVALGAQEAVAVVAQVEQSFDFEELAGVGLVGVGHGVAPEALAAVAIAAVAAVASGRVVAEVAGLAFLARLGVWTRVLLGRSEPFMLGAEGAVSVVGESTAAEVSARALDASATNSPSRSSKSSVGVATVRRERTARETESEASLAGAGSPMIASMSEALEARADTSTPFTLAMVWRSSRVLDSRSDRSGEGLTAMVIPFAPLDKIE